MKIAVAGTGYVGLSLAVLLSQNNEVCAVDIIPEKVDMINNKISPIKDNEIEEFLKTKKLNITATLDADKAYKDAQKILKLENWKIPEDIDYKTIPNLASEAREKLERVRPMTISQAQRISGVNPSDISILLVYLESGRHNGK